MNDLFQTVWGLLRLKAGPQELPSSWPLTGLVLAVFIGQAILTTQHLGDETGASRSIVAIAIQLVAVAAMLRFRGHPERLEQTLMAIAATGTVLGLLLFVFLIQADPEVNQPFLAMVYFAIFGWSLAVDANIYRHALGISMSLGVLVAVVLLALTYVVLDVAYRT